MKDRVRRNAMARARCAAGREKVNSYNRAWYAKNKDKIKARELAYRTLNRDKVNTRSRVLYALNRPKHREHYRQNRESILIERRAKKYGIAVCDLERLIDSRQGKCDLCGRTFGPKGPCIDHCHKHTHIRGVLCTRCNVAIGMFDHSEKILVAALKYISKEALFNAA